MSGTLTLKKDTVFKQDPFGKDQDQAKVKANQPIKFSYIEIKDYRGTPFTQHQHLEVHLENSIPPDGSNKPPIFTWFVDVKDVARIE
ncbi:MAG: hypothetical protein KME30_29495 [Iphinoe sp. HA4291-MV1]|jgi:hypothetical protein|nr:hypothetical protein [Iphinoe sp. HA4291-MV1]